MKIGDIQSQGRPVFHAQKSATTSIGAFASTKAIFDNELIDTTGDYDPVTNYRYTPSQAGYYYFSTTLQLDVTGTMSVMLYLNGAPHKISWLSAVNTGVASSLMVDSVIFMNGTTDYVESYVKNWESASKNNVAGANSTFLGFKLI